MWKPFSGLLDSSTFMPHGHCFQWNRTLLALNVISDGVIALSYYSIPVLLVVFVRRRRDLPYAWLFCMFGAFIMACGTTHILEIWTIWKPQYWLAGFLKAGTASVSIATALALIPVVPKALALRSPVEIERVNQEMAREIAQRCRAEAALARHVEELRRSNAELEHFAHVASHDLREPLRAIGSFTQLIARRYRGKLDREADQFMGHTLNGVKRMEQLLDDLLAYSRAGSARLYVRPVDCELALEHGLKNLVLSIVESRAEITHDPLPVVPGDAVQIEQLLQNLLSNALKFRGEATPHVHVSAVREGSVWRFRVRDNGIGVQAEYAEQIFAVFKRLHGTAAYAGTGVGLAICERIVQRHGGKIWLGRNGGSGAEFHFTLPAEVPAEVPADEMTAEAA